ncbi:hypothetical protein FGG78_26470, partial [Thioclava sp. BHET1]
TMAERIISQGSQLILFVAAARVLSPAEFGIFALVSTCAILLLRMSEVGWAPYIMSWQGDDRVPRQVLLVAMCTGLVTGVITAITAVVLPYTGAQPVVSHLLLLFSIWVFLATTSAAQKGMMIWRDGLRASAMCESIGEVAGMGVALTTLYHGAGVLALAYGRLTYQSVHLLLSFGFTRRLPLGGMTREDLRQLAIYSWQIFSSRFIYNLRLYLATFVIGAFLGPAPVGFYRAAQRLVSAIAELVSAPALVLAWSMLRQARDSHGLPSAGYQRQVNLFFQVLFAVALPIFIWLTLMGEDLIKGLLGSQWLPALPIVAVLSLARALALIGSATEPLLSLAGEIRRLPKVTLILLLLSLAMTTLGAIFGLEAVAWAQVAVGIVSGIVTIHMIERYGAVDIRGILKELRLLLAPLLAGTLVILFLRDMDGFDLLPALARALIVPVPALAVYLLALGFARPDLMRRTLARIGWQQGA